MKLLNFQSNNGNFLGGRTRGLLCLPIFSFNRTTLASRPKCPTAPSVEPTQRPEQPGFPFAGPSPAHPGPGWPSLAPVRPGPAWPDWAWSLPGCPGWAGQASRPGRPGQPAGLAGLGGLPGTGPKWNHDGRKAPANLASDSDPRPHHAQGPDHASRPRSRVTGRSRITE